jgi:hypothetical protein
MSRLTEYFTAEALKAAGWPKSKGTLRKQLYLDTRVVDSIVEQAIQIAVGLGAGLPRRGVAFLADSFQNNPWTKESTAKLIRDFIKEAELTVNHNPELPPWKALYNPHRLASYGNDIPVKDFGDPGFQIIRTKVAALAIFWGLTHESEMPRVLANAKADYEQEARSAIQYGLNVPAQYPHDSIERFYEHCEGLVHGFEAVRPPLSEIPRELREAPEVARRLDSDSGART